MTTDTITLEKFIVEPTSDLNINTLHILRGNFSNKNPIEHDILERFGLPAVETYVVEMKTSYNNDKPFVEVTITNEKPINDAAKGDPLRAKASSGQTPIEVVTEFNTKANVGLNKHQRELVAHLMFNIYRQAFQNGMQATLAQLPAANQNKPS